MIPLNKKTCMACQLSTTSLKGSQLIELKKQLQDDWEIVNEKHLRKVYPFPNFVKGLQFVNAVGEVAEKEGHHPDIHLSYQRVVIELYTHKTQGLTENDFILADKIDVLYASGI